MKTVLVIDDLKSFDFPYDWNIIYARTLEDGLKILHGIMYLPSIESPEELELWLDHDLGGDDTIRPLCLMLAEMAYYGSTYPFSRIVICSKNPVGRDWIKSTLRDYPVVSLY